MDSLYDERQAMDSLYPTNDSLYHEPSLYPFKQPMAHEPRIYEGTNDDALDTQFYHRASLLQELYDHDLAEQQWHPQQQYHMVRRATFPYVRHDRDEFPPFDVMPSMTNSPHREFDDTPAIKLEDTPALITQPPFFPSYLSPHSGLPVQHTDDAASKETQYLRRRCFNCHTTEPPSWRRSTLNPGKIVCNKCGLYERTHLRPRPLRFDELRAGNKARTNKTKGTVSPKPKMSLIKKEPRDLTLVRRSSVSSSSGSGASDWDDNVSVYSSGSAPPTSFNSPNTNTFPLSRDSASPPRDPIGIRLPNASLSDLAGITSPRKAHTLPAGTYYSPPPTEWQPIVTASPPSATMEIAISEEEASS